MVGSFHIRTFGCQMNQHDAEKMANLLYHAGLRPAAGPEAADVVLIHTCSVRDKAEQKLYSELGSLLARKRPGRGPVVGVGGCVAQQEGVALLRRFPGLDFVFGPQNLVHLPELVAAARAGARAGARAARLDYPDEPESRFELPHHHPEYTSPTPGRAFVTVMEGCDLYCSFCVVPRTRGREVSRSSGAILDEVRRLADGGVVEVTLLGQTVNAYGRPRPGRARGEIAFSELIRRIDAIPGIERIRFTSPHPIFLTPDLASCYRDVEALCPHVHLPVQSGSSSVLRAMNRRYDRERYLEIVAGLRSERPDLAITTDIIVGFPGETEQDFEQTLSLVESVRFTDSFSFKYSPRPGTPAVRRGLEGVDAAEASRRLDALQALQGELTQAAHRARVGQRVGVLVEGASRHGGAQQRGRCAWNRVVNFAAERPLEPGRVAPIDITGATPHSLLGVAASSGQGAAELPLY